MEVDQLAEVGIHGDQDPMLVVREPEKRPVSRIGTELRSLNDVVPCARSQSASLLPAQRSTRNLKPRPRRLSRAYPGR